MDNDRVTQRRAAIAEMLEIDGTTPDIIAEELGVSVSLVYQDLKAMGVDVKQRGRGRGGEIASAYTAGEKLSTIALRFGVSVSFVYQVLAEEGVPLRSVDPTAVQGRQMQLEEAVRLYGEGASLRTIEQETGVSVNALYRELGRRGVPLRRVHWQEGSGGEREREKGRS